MPAEPARSRVHGIATRLEAAGVIFIEENGEGPGVRLKKAIAYRIIQNL